MKVLISAAESSSDAHGAELLKALRRIDPNVRAFGIGGSKLEAAGLRRIVRAEDLLAMGFTEVIGKLPKVVDAIARVERAASWERPDVAVVIDYPDFHFKLIRRLKRQGIPVVYYIPPKIWAWRRGRARFLRKMTDAVLGIFPFEIPFFQDRGMPFRYVGNPLLDELPLGLTRDEARRKLGLAIDGGASTQVITLMPGSRPAELKRHLDLMLESVKLCTSLVQERIEVLIPLPDAERAEWLRRRWYAWVNQLPASQRSRFNVRISHGDAGICLAASDAGMIKSGTSTLEAGILGCPHVVLYVPSPISCWIFKTFVRYKGDIALSNLVLGQRKAGEKPVFREYYCKAATAAVLSRELYQILKTPDRRQECIQASAKIRDILGNGTSASSEGPSMSAAREVMRIGLLKRQRRAPPAAIGSFSRAVSIWVGSALWSTANAWISWLVSNGFLKPMRLNARVVSVGNIQSGGSGKTPLVARIARDAIRRELRVCILTRGYRGLWEDSCGVILPGDAPVDPAYSGDEPALLQSLVPGATIAVGADRIAAYRKALEISGQEFDWVILDDGLQNYRIEKDIEIVAMTSKRRSEVVFRDWKRRLKSADLIVWTKGEENPVTERHQKLVRVHYDYNLTPLSSSKSLYLVTAVADGNQVREMIESRGSVVEVHRVFKDHASFTHSEAEQIAKESRERGLRLAMTGKDYVKWKEFGIHEEVLELEPFLRIVEGETVWNQTLWGDSLL